MATQCPVCGSEELDTHAEDRVYTPPFGASAHYSVELSTCRVCGVISEDNDESAVKAIMAEADQASVVTILDSLSADGISMAYIERALGLPARTIFRWKRGELSAAGLALLRIVRAFPWMLEVSAAGFEKTQAPIMVARSGVPANSSVYPPVSSFGAATPVVASPTIVVSPSLHVTSQTETQAVSLSERDLAA